MSPQRGSIALYLSWPLKEASMLWIGGAWNYLRSIHLPLRGHDPVRRRAVLSHISGHSDSNRRIFEYGEQNVREGLQEARVQLAGKAFDSMALVLDKLRRERRVPHAAAGICGGGSS